MFTYYKTFSGEASLAVMSDLRKENLSFFNIKINCL